MDGDDRDNERWPTSLNTAHLFKQLAEGKHNTHANAHGGPEVTMAFLQQNGMAFDGEVGKE